MSVSFTTRSGRTITTLDDAVETGDLATVNEAIRRGMPPDTDQGSCFTTERCSDEIWEPGETDFWGAYQLVPTGRYTETERTVPSFYFHPTLEKAIPKTVEIVKAILTTQPKLYPRSLIDAFNTRNINIVSLVSEAFIQRGEPINEKNLPDLADRSISLELIQRVIRIAASQKGGVHIPSSLIKRTDALRIAIQAGAKPDSDTLDTAIRSENLETIQIILDVGGQLSANSLGAALGTKNLNVVLKVLSLNPPLYEEACNHAISTHNPQILQAVLALGARPCNDQKGQVWNDLNSLNLGIKTKDIRIVTPLVRAGAKASTGPHSLDLAIETEDPQIVLAVQTAGAVADVISTKQALKKCKNKEIKRMVKVPIDWGYLRREIYLRCCW